jgi:McrBC 5-methylcytosine restriction system component
MPERLIFKENASQQVAAELLRQVTVTARDLDGVLRPRQPVASFEGDTVTFRNLVGSARLPGGDIIEISPKVDDVGEWTSAVVQLLEPGTRVSVTGSQRSQPSTRRNDLASAIALEYARRLEAALRHDGPINIYERQHKISRRLTGHLDVTKWVRSAVLDPTKFPHGFDALTTANDFTRALSLVAGWLSRVATDGELSSRLRRLQTAVIPDHPVPTYVNPAVAQRPLPPQWFTYMPAWYIAASLLRHRSVVGDPGRAAGLEVAVEPWPLLENVLVRALQTLAMPPYDYEFVPKARYTLLSHAQRPALSVIPDGALRRENVIVATFEAKYTVPGPSPAESHVHQALATAAALSSPTSILVYPGNQAPRRYKVTGFHGTPVSLITLGLQLFSYKRGIGDIERASLIRNVLAQAST